MIDQDEFDELVEIVDALCNTLAHGAANDQTIESIAERARKLYRKRMGEE